MSLETKYQTDPPPAGPPLPVAPVRPRPSGPLVASAFLIVALAAYLLGRGTAPAPRPEPPAATVGDPKEQAGASQRDRQSEPATAASEPIRLDADAEKTAGVKTIPARHAAIGEEMTVPGTVEVSPDRTARVTPPVAGTIIALLAAPGDRVRAGQSLALLNSPEVAQAHAAISQAEATASQARAQAQSAAAGVQQAETKRESARTTLQRQRDLAATGAFSQPTLQVAQNEVNAAQSERAQAQTDLRARGVVVQRNERLFKEQLVAKAELEESQVAERQARTRAEEAEQRLAIARQALEREQMVFRGGLLSRQAVQTAEADLRATEGDVRQARKQEQAAQTALEGARSALGAARVSLRALEGTGHAPGGAGRIALCSPFDGVIARRDATTGEAVERSSNLFTVQNLETVSVEAYVPEANVARIRVGAPVTVTVAAYPNARFAGIVQSVGGQVDEKTRALPIRCRVQNRGGALRPEMFARVSLTTGTSSRALVVPDAAVDEDGEKRFVYVRAGPGAYKKQEVAIGRSEDGLVEIRDGLTVGEAVVTDGMFVLKSESKKNELKGDED
jgi:cobalt-zinc-cadmium efflux system membrane fusion protein